MAKTSASDRPWSGGARRAAGLESFTDAVDRVDRDGAGAATAFWRKGLAWLGRRGDGRWAEALLAALRFGLRPMRFDYADDDPVWSWTVSFHGLVGVLPDGLKRRTFARLTEAWEAFLPAYEALPERTKLGLLSGYYLGTDIGAYDAWTRIETT